MFALTATTLLSLLTLASTAPTSNPVYPPTSQSLNFRLVANVTTPNPSIQIDDYVLTSYHIGAGEAYAVLVPNVTVTSGRIFYVNGTASDVYYRNSNIPSDEGTPLFPAGLSIIPASTTSSSGPLVIDAGEGQAGIGLSQFPDPISKLYNGGLGDGRGFYACNNELEYGEAVQVLFKQAGDVTPEGCVDVVLLPQCSEGSGAADEFAANSQCYEDVAGIDWSVYSS